MSKGDDLLALVNYARDVAKELARLEVEMGVGHFHTFQVSEFVDECMGRGVQSKVCAEEIIKQFSSQA